MTFNAQKYGALLSETLPGVINSHKEYKRVEKIFNNYISRGEDNLSVEEFRLFELLANLLEEYEKRTLPPLKASTPAAALKFLMEQNNLTQDDLTDIFGDQSAVSKVLSGKRTIGNKIAVKLSERFNVSTDLFLKEF